MISIHTTRKVVTGGSSVYTATVTDFNPHHPQGGDAITAAQFDEWFISIHTTRKVVTAILHKNHS